MAVKDKLFKKVKTEQNRTLGSHNFYTRTASLNLDSIKK